MSDWDSIDRWVIREAEGINMRTNINRINDWQRPFVTEVIMKKIKAKLAVKIPYNVLMEERMEVVIDEIADMLTFQLEGFISKEVMMEIRKQVLAETDDGMFLRDGEEPEKDSPDNWQIIADESESIRQNPWNRNVQELFRREYLATPPPPPPTLSPLIRRRPARSTPSEIGREALRRFGQEIRGIWVDEEAPVETMGEAGRLARESIAREINRSIQEEINNHVADAVTYGIGASEIARGTGTTLGMTATEANNILGARGARRDMAGNGNAKLRSLIATDPLLGRRRWNRLDGY